MNRKNNGNPEIYEVLNIPVNSSFQLSTDPVNKFILISYKEDNH